ncbi:MAG: MSMEG_0567/sll0787 family protein [Pseudonocardiaceae bacterium]
MHTAVPYRSSSGLGEALLGQPARRPDFHIELATDRNPYYQLRHRVFVHQQELFTDHDHDERDDDSRTLVLVARNHTGTVLGGVRLGPIDNGPDLGWWFGGRLVVDPGCALRGVGAALVRAACAHAESAGVLRFEATVQARNEVFFQRLGWTSIRPLTLAGTPHMLMRWPIGRIAALVTATKADLGGLLSGINPGGTGFLGDDGAPIPGSDLVAACDAILPSMVEQDPEWAGWCAVLVNVNDLAAMAATPVGLLDALGARDRSFASRVLAGLRRASQAYEVPILGGHTQFGVPAALAVTALGRAADPIRGAGGRPGHRLRLTVDTAGGWRPGYAARQWDSTSLRRTPELRAMLGSVAAARPAAAKDVSMAGLAGTAGMLAEASGCRAVLEVAAVPRPSHATVGDWFTCFPGFGMLTAAEPGAAPLPASPAVSAECGELVTGRGVALRWPDGELTEVITDAVTGLGAA